LIYDDFVVYTNVSGKFQTQETNRVENMKHPIFIKSVGRLLLCFGIGIFLITRANKPKIDFQKLTGKITYLLNKLPNEEVRRDGKERYLQIENSDRVFNIFVGKDWSDFKPKFEIIDSLKVGDNIDLYFDDNSITESNQINNLTQYIDSNGKVFFIKGKMDETFGKFIIGISALSILILYLLKRYDKII
jgi:hypothetical protein